MDFLATVDRFPNPDDKVRSSSLKVEGGGNAGNALTCAARLGLKPKLISKIADDAHGFAILKELEADGVDTNFIVVRSIFFTSFFFASAACEQVILFFLFLQGVQFVKSLMFYLRINNNDKIP